MGRTRKQTTFASREKITAGAGVVEFFRAVSLDEASDIRACGTFRPGPNSSEFGKHFTGTIEEARRFGEMLYKTKPFKCVKIEVTNDVAAKLEIVLLADKCGRAWFAYFPELYRIPPLFVDLADVGEV